MLEAGGVEEAEALLLDAYEVLAENRGPTHRRTLETVQWLIDLCGKLGQAAQADVWRGPYNETSDELAPE